MKQIFKWPEDFINKIICKDCLKTMPFIPSKSIDMVVCDLPYYEEEGENWYKTLPVDKLNLQYKRIIKKGGIIVLSVNPIYEAYLIYDNSEMYQYKWNWDDEDLLFFYDKNNYEYEKIVKNEKLKEKYIKKSTCFELFKCLIKIFTKEGGLVLDNCIGDGATAIACKELNRKYIGIEIDSKKCKKAKRRLLKNI